MKIIIACDSYKGSASTFEIADSIERGIRKVDDNIEIIKIPVADGGEGTVEALVQGRKGEYEEVTVLDPLGREIKSRYGIIDDNIGIVEMASASGLTLLKSNELNPLITTTYGTGQLIKAAMEKGLRKILIGLGGSSTNDGGVGMAQALGISFKNNKGEGIGFGGGELINIEDIDISNAHPLLKETEIIIMTDVNNPFYGPNGAATIFAPQKGATDEMVKILDNNLKYLALKIKNILGKEIDYISGSGAAGGLGGGLVAFTNGNIISGIDKILDTMEIDKYLENANLVITGEGKIDGQSALGKVPIGVGERAMKYNIPVIALVGSVGEGAEKVYDKGIDLIMDIISKPMTLEEAMEDVNTLVEKAGENIMRIINLGGKIR